MSKIHSEDNMYNPHDSDQFCCPVAPTILMSMTFWFLYYIVVCVMLPKNDAEFCNRLVTLTHGSTTAFLGINDCFSNYLFTYQGQTGFQKGLIIYSLGYFLFDLGWCVYHQSETKLMIAHHICTIFSMARIIYKNYSGLQTTCALGCMEITNPLLQARWFVRTAGYHNSVLFHSVEFTFMLVFFVVRLLVGSVYVIMILLNSNNYLEFKIHSIVIYTIGWMFFLNMMKYVSNKYVHEDMLYPPNDGRVVEGSGANS